MMRALAGKGNLREEASVIPTEAQRSGGIPRLPLSLRRGIPPARNDEQ
jgi:hypothetical protein